MISLNVPVFEASSREVFLQPLEIHNSVKTSSSSMQMVLVSFWKYCNFVVGHLRKNTSNQRYCLLYNFDQYFSLHFWSFTITLLNLSTMYYILNSGHFFTNILFRFSIFYRKIFGFAVKLTICPQIIVVPWNSAYFTAMNNCLCCSCKNWSCSDISWNNKTY